MKALKFYDVRDLRYEEVKDPRIEKSTDAIVKVKATGICGSDIARYRKLGPYVKGNIWGHEFSGEVIEIGSDVRNIKVGDRVVGCPSIICHECVYCKLGQLSKCEKLSAIGALVPGAFAEYINIPAVNLVPMPEEMTYEEGALVEPTTVVLHGLYQTNLQMGYEVAVIGCGSIGLLTIEWAKVFGVKKILAIDVNNDKLRLAEKIGADIVINPTDKDLYDEVRKYGNGVDLAIESAGSPITAANVLTLPHKGGEVLYLGIPYADVNMPRFCFEKTLRNELSVKGSWSCISAPFPGKEWFNAVYFIGKKSVDLAKIISHKMGLSEGAKVFEAIMEKPQEFGKVLLIPE